MCADLPLVAARRPLLNVSLFREKKRELVARVCAPSAVMMAVLFAFDLFSRSAYAFLNQRLLIRFSDSKREKSV